MIIWLSWVDDCVVSGSSKDAKNKKKKLKQLFECNDSVELMEYIGTKVEVDRVMSCIRLTQPVMIQSFCDEIVVSMVKKWSIPALTEQILTKESVR